MLLANLLRRRCCSSLPLLLGTVVALWFCSSHHVAATGSKVEYLPGVQPEGPLPFELETGYIGVGELEDIQLFYYFVKSESNPNIDPIVLWISGGPECSSFVAMTEEFVRTGFSYAKSSKNYTATDVETSYHAAEFIRKWLEDHFQYQSNSFYVGGDSYSGITVPMIVQAISYGIDARLKPRVNLKGYVIGNGVTVPVDNYEYTYGTARGLGLISEEQYTMVSMDVPQNIYWPNVVGEENDAKRFRGYNVHAFDRSVILLIPVLFGHALEGLENTISGDKEDGETSLVKRATMETYCGIPASETIVVHPPKVSKNKGSDRRIKSRREIAIKGMRKKGRTCKTCGLANEHDSRNCVKRKKRKLGVARAQTQNVRLDLLIEDPAMELIASAHTEKRERRRRGDGELIACAHAETEREVDEATASDGVRRGITEAGKGKRSV
nr:serine carboxypeptidase-like 11 isoform X2 [Ipomoea batatas]